jgi:glucokinase
MPVNEIGPKCNCGGSGCLEAYIGNQRILNAAKKVFGRAVSLEELSRLANRGNRKAVKLWEDAGVHLGVVLTGIVNLLNPDSIVIGGGVAKAGKVLFNKVRRVVRERAMPVQVKALNIVPATLGSDAGLIGAGLLVKEGLL